MGTSIEVAERKLDAKRRVTLPNTAAFKKGSKVLIIASPDSAIITSDRQTAENLGKVLHELEGRRKELALDEWERLVVQAGLSGLSSEGIDGAVGRRIRRPRRANASEAAGSR